MALDAAVEGDAAEVAVSNRQGGSGGLSASTSIYVVEAEDVPEPSYPLAAWTSARGEASDSPELDAALDAQREVLNGRASELLEKLLSDFDVSLSPAGVQTFR